MSKRRNSLGSQPGSEDSEEEFDLALNSKRPRTKCVKFGGVTVFYFPRRQGFVSVPSSGGSTLGMAKTHCFVECEDILDSDCEDACVGKKIKQVVPIPLKARRKLLRISGVKRILKQEEDDCMQLRLSRIICGCNCGDICYPETCQCSLNGIGCQVDYGRFPCSCLPNGCQNFNGRKQYDPSTIEKHYSETFTKLNGLAVALV